MPPLVLKYLSGEEIKKGDHILHHGEPGTIEFVALALGAVETDWYVKEFGGGVMVVDRAFGHIFIPADQLAEYEDLEFVSRA